MWLVLFIIAVTRYITSWIHLFFYLFVLFLCNLSPHPVPWWILSLYLHASFPTLLPPSKPGIKHVWLYLMKKIRYQYLTGDEM